MGWLSSTWSTITGRGNDRDAQSGVALPEGEDYGPGLAPGSSTGIIDQLRRDGRPWPGSERAKRSGAGRAVATQRLKSGPAGVVYPWLSGTSVFDGSRETERMRRDYRLMSSDPNCSSAWKGLIYSVASQDLKILPATRKDPLDQQIADYIRWQFEERLAGGIPKLIWDILWGMGVDGYSLNYKVWGEPEQRGKWYGKVPLRMTRAVDVDLDAVPQTNSFYDIVGIKGLRYNGGEEFAPSDFIIAQHCPQYGSPRGTSVFRCVHRAWLFFNAALALRGVAAEKKATPFIWGSWKTTTQKTSLETMLKAMKSQNWASVPDGVMLNALDLAGAEESIFKTFMGDLQEWIYLGIQHATLQTLTGGAGEQRGNSKVHLDQTQLVRWYLSTIIEALLNNYETGLIRDCVDLNFAGVMGYPRGKLSNVDVEEMIKEAELDKALQDLGLDLSREETYDKYARTPPQTPDDVLKAKQPEQPMHNVMMHGGVRGGQPPVAASGAAKEGLPGENEEGQEATSDKQELAGGMQ